MKDERNNIDKLFSDGLGDFNPAPPPELWDRIGTEIPAPLPLAPGAATNGLSRLIFLGIAAAFFTGLAVLWFVADNNNAELQKNNSLLQSKKTDAGITDIKPINKSENDNPAETKNTAESEQQTNPEENRKLTAHEKTVNPSETALTTPLTSTSEIETITPQVPAIQNQFSESEIQANVFHSNTGIGDLRSDFTTWLNSLPAGLMTASAVTVFNNHYKTSQKPSMPKGHSIPLIGGIYASVDQIDYGKGHKKQSYAAGLSLSTFKGPWILETGVAYCLNGDNGRYMINYNSWDSLGYYNRVVSFSPDPDNPGTIKFNTEVEGVYDSIDHALETKTINKYAYLQIPLMAGYQIYSNRLMTISLKAGPVFSLLMGSNEPAAIFNIDGANLQSIDNLSTTRVSSNWQIVAGLGVGFHLSRSLTFLAEPTYKTYLRPVYRNHSTKPQSIGIKAGLLYRF